MSHINESEFTDANAQRGSRGTTEYQRLTQERDQYRQALRESRRECRLLRARHRELEDAMEIIFSLAEHERTLEQYVAERPIVEDDAYQVRAHGDDQGDDDVDHAGLARHDVTHEDTSLGSVIHDGMLSTQAIDLFEILEQTYALDEPVTLDDIFDVGFRLGQSAETSARQLAELRSAGVLTLVGHGVFRYTGTKPWF